MCIDSAAKPEDMHLEIGLWPCHNQGGNQVDRYSFLVTINNNQIVFKLYFRLIALTYQALYQIIQNKTTIFFLLSA